MSVSKLAKQRGKILDEIMRYHRENLPKVMREVPFEDVRALAQVAPPVQDFADALAAPGVSLIAECKKASPSRGLLLPNYDAPGLATSYIRAGARAISVLTDARHFQGALSDLRDVKEALASRRIAAPVLRKDFIFHPYQIFESRAAGADAVLLIASVVEGAVLKELLSLTAEVGMDALVEVHTEEELERVASLGPNIIGINNRDLQTFQVDFANTARLVKEIPANMLTVAESGIQTGEDVREMARIGVDAILVGEALVRSKNPEKTARQFVAAGEPSG